MSIRAWSLLACLSVLLMPPAIGAEPPPTPTGTKRALLIGINRYQNLPSLRGSINDIETMRHVLLTRWGFQAQHIRMLKDQEATRAGLLAALNRFIEETGPQDMVYIHYSGHGSQVEDLNGDEPDDHLDETLVPHDGRTGSVPDITDDELDVLFAKLNAKAALIVLASCHSGTATRSVDIQTRSVPPDSRRHLYRPDSVQSRQVVPLLTSRYVLMTGAAAHQEALDGPVNGRYQGFFSHSLSKSISTAGSSPTPRNSSRGWSGKCAASKFLSAAPPCRSRSSRRPLPCWIRRYCWGAEHRPIGSRPNPSPGRHGSTCVRPVPMRSC